MALLAQIPFTVKSKPPFDCAQGRLRTHEGGWVKGFACCLILALLLGGGAAWAQDGSTGAIRGTAVDATGGRIVGAQVTVTKLDTGVARQAATDGEGRFVVELLPP